MFCDAPVIRKRNEMLPSKPRVHEIGFYLMSSYEIEHNLSVMSVTRHELYDSGNTLITNATIAASVVNKTFHAIEEPKSSTGRAKKKTKKTNTATDVPKLSSKLMAITNSTNVKNRIEMEGGLLDYRLGSTDRRHKCKTCGFTGGRYGCPGHFGHISLNYPVFFIMTIGWCKNLLNVLCHFCSRLLIDKHMLLKHVGGNEHAWLQLSASERWDKLMHCKRSNVCLHECLVSPKSNILAGAPQPTYQVSKLHVVPNWSAAMQFIEKQKRLRQKLGEQPNDSAALVELEIIARKPFTAGDAWYILNNITPEDLEFLGYTVHPISGCGHPRNMILTAIPVEPKQLRPSASFDRGRMRSQNDKTRKYQEIIKANIEIGNAISECTGNLCRKVTPEMLVAMMTPPSGAIATPPNKGFSISNMMSFHYTYATELANYEWHISTLFNNEIKGVKVDRQRSGKPYKSLNQYFVRKEGWWRHNTVAKRCDHTSRTVVTPCSSLDLDELGVPFDMCVTNTIDVRVTRYNIGDLTQAVRLGPWVLGGASHVYTEDNTEIDLKYCTSRASILLRTGMIVSRYIRKGDYVLFNRQPSLHKPSIMAQRVVPMSGYTFRMNLSATMPYNADFDGDEMNMHVVQGPEERTEIEHLMNVKSNLLSSQSSKLTMSLVQDALVAAWRMTRRDQFFTRDQAYTLLGQLKYFKDAAFKRLGPPTFVKPYELYTGRQVFSAALFPEDLNYERWRNTKPKPYQIETASSEIGLLDLADAYDDHVLIVRGRLLHGRLCKQCLGTSAGGIVYAMCHRRYGVSDDERLEYVDRFLSETQRLVNYYLLAYDNFSIGPGDLVLTSAVRQDVRNVVKTTIRKDARLKLLSVPGAFKTPDALIEHARQKLLKRLLPKCAELAAASLPDLNGCKTVVDCGSKGSSINIGQMTSCVGQQTVEGTRLIKGRLPCFARNATDGIAQGLVKHSLLHGLNPHEFFHHAQAGREGLVDTAVKTAETGYIQRRVVRASENICVDEDYTVRKWDGSVLQLRYGGDGWATERLVRCSLPYMSYPTNEAAVAALRKNFCFSSETMISEEQQECFDQFESVKDEMIRQRQVRAVAYYKLGTAPIDEVYMPCVIEHTIELVFSGPRGSTPATIGQIKSLLTTMLLTITNKMSISGVTNLTRDYYLRASLPFKRFLKLGATAKQVDTLCRFVLTKFRDAVCPPGTAVGLSAGESIGEPTTQMTLDTFHFCGVQTTKMVTSGVPRMQELVALFKTIKLTTMTIVFKNDQEQATCKDAATKFAYKLIDTTIADVTLEQKIFNVAQPDDPRIQQLFDMYSMFADTLGFDDAVAFHGVLITLDHMALMYRDMVPYDVAKALRAADVGIQCVLASDPNSPEGWYVYYLLPESEDTYQIARCISTNTHIGGVSNITKTNVRKEVGVYVIDTTGSNLADVLAMPAVDPRRTTTNNLYEIEAVLGIDAASDALFYEYKMPMEAADANINDRHLSLVADLQCTEGLLKALTRHGINQDHAPLTQISFEKSIENMYKSALFSKTDHMCDVASNVMLGQNIPLGTGKIGFSYKPSPIPKNSREPQEFKLQIDNMQTIIEQHKSIAQSAATLAIVFTSADESNTECLTQHILKTIDAAYGCTGDIVNTKHLPCSLPQTLTRSTLVNIIHFRPDGFTVREKTDGVRYLMLLGQYENKPFACLVNRSCQITFIAIAAMEPLFTLGIGSLYDVEMVGQYLLVLDVCVHAGLSLMRVPWCSRYELVQRTFYIEPNCYRRLQIIRAGVTTNVDDVLENAIRIAGSNKGTSTQQSLSMVAANMIICSRDIRVSFEPKKCYPMSSITELLLNTQNLMSTELPCDGLIIQRCDTGIQAYADPNLFKWKPASMATIDVKFDLGEDGYDVDQWVPMVFDNQSLPTTYKPLDTVGSYMVSVELDSADSLYTEIIMCSTGDGDISENPVVECTVQYEDFGETACLSLRPIRVREKNHANSTYVIKSVLESIRENLTLDELFRCTQQPSTPPEQRLTTSIPATPNCSQMDIYRPASPQTGNVVIVVDSADNDSNALSGIFDNPTKTKKLYRPPSPKPFLQVAASHSFPKLMQLPNDEYSTKLEFQ